MVAAFSNRRRRPDALLATAVAANAAVVAAVAVGLPLLFVALALVAVPVGVAVIDRPQRGVVLLIALLPYDGLLLLVPGLDLAGGWKEALVLATLFAALIAPESVRGPIGRPLPPFVPVVVALGALALVSLVVSGVGVRGLYGLKVLLFFTLLAAAAWRCPLSSRERDLVVGSLMVNGLVVASWGIGQQLVGADRLHGWGYEYNSVIRFSGGFLRSFSTFEDPFGFAYFLLVVLCIGVPVALADPQRFRNRAFLFGLPILLLGLSASVVRGAFLGAAVLIVYLGFRAASRRRALLVAFPLALATLLVVPTEVTAPALSSTSTGERATGWTGILPEVVSRPLGSGIGSAGSAADKVATIQALDVETYQPDSVYMLRLIELGPLAVALQVALLVVAFRMARFVAHAHRGTDRALADGVAALTAAAAVASFISTFFEIFPADALWWALVAIVASMIPARPEAAAPPVHTARAIDVT